GPALTEQASTATATEQTSPGDRDSAPAENADSPKPVQPAVGGTLVGAVLVGTALLGVWLAHQGWLGHAAVGLGVVAGVVAMTVVAGRLGRGLRKWSLPKTTRRALAAGRRAPAHGSSSRVGGAPRGRRTGGRSTPGRLGRIRAG